MPRIRQMLAMASFFLGAFYFGKDWIADKEFLCGLSYLLSGIGLAGIFVLGFVSWEKTIAAYIIGLVSGGLSIFSVFAESRQLQNGVAEARAALSSEFSAIAVGLKRSVPGASAYASNHISACYMQDISDLGFMAGQLTEAMYMKPELSLLTRLRYGKEDPPQDICKETYQTLRAMDEKMFVAMEQQYQALQDGGYFRK